MARAIQLDSGLGDELFMYALIHSAHIRNRLYMRVRVADGEYQGTTPYEVVFGTKPNISRLRIFGSPAYVHAEKKKRAKKKMHPTRAEKGIMIGFESPTCDV